MPFKIQNATLNAARKDGLITFDFHHSCATQAAKVIKGLYSTFVVAFDTPFTRVKGARHLMHVTGESKVPLYK